MNHDRLRKLYEGVSPYVDAGDFETFSQRMTDKRNREAFFNQASQYVDLGVKDFPEFESRLTGSRDQQSAQPAEPVGAVESFVNAFQRSFYYDTKANIEELFDRQAAEETRQEAAAELPVDPGAAGFVGSALGSAAKFIPAVVASAAAAPAAGAIAIGTLGLAATEMAGSGLDAVRTYEEKSGEKVDDSIKGLVAVGYGSAAFVLERMGLRFLDDALAQLTPTALAKIGAAISSGSAKSAAKVVSKEIGTIALQGGRIEATQEGLEQLVTNSLDNLYQEKSLTEGLLPSTIGGFIGGAFLLGTGGSVKAFRGQRALSVQADEEFDDFLNGRGGVKLLPAPEDITAGLEPDAPNRPPFRDEKGSIIVPDQKKRLEPAKEIKQLPAPKKAKISAEDIFSDYLYKDPVSEPYRDENGNIVTPFKLSDLNEEALRSLAKKGGLVFNKQGRDVTEDAIEFELALRGKEKADIIERVRDEYVRKSPFGKRALLDFYRWLEKHKVASGIIAAELETPDSIYGTIPIQAGWKYVTLRDESGLPRVDLIQASRDYKNDLREKGIEYLKREGFGHWAARLEDESADLNLEALLSDLVKGQRDPKLTDLLDRVVEEHQRAFIQSQPRERLQRLFGKDSENVQKIKEVLDATLRGTREPLDISNPANPSQSFPAVDFGVSQDEFNKALLSLAEEGTIRKMHADLLIMVTDAAIGNIAKWRGVSKDRVFQSLLSLKALPLDPSDPGNRGSFEFVAGSDKMAYSLIELFRSPITNPSESREIFATALHEIGHFIDFVLTPKEKRAIDNFVTDGGKFERADLSKPKPGGVMSAERYASAFTKYLAEPRNDDSTLTRAFRKILDIIRSIALATRTWFAKVSGVDVAALKLDGDIRDHFDRLLKGLGDKTPEMIIREAEKRGKTIEDLDILAMEYLNSNLAFEKGGKVKRPDGEVEGNKTYFSLTEKSPTPFDPNADDYIDKMKRRVKDIPFIARLLNSPEFLVSSFRKNTKRVDELRPLKKVIERNISAELYYAELMTQKQSEINDALMKRDGTSLSKEEQKQVRSALEDIYASIVTDPDGLRDRAAKNQDVYRSAFRVKKIFETARADIQSFLRKNLLQNFGPEMLAAFEMAFQTGKVKKAAETFDADLDDLRKLLQDYRNIDQWGSPDYITNIELGDYLVVDSTGSVRAAGKTRRSAKKKMKKLEEETGEKFAIEEEASTRLDPFVHRKGVLKGEENIFDALPTYLRLVYKRIIVSPTIRFAESEMRKNPDFFRGNIRGIVEDQIKALKSEYTLGDQLFDSIFRKLGLQGRSYSRLVGRIRQTTAIAKLGYRPSAALINFVSGHGHTWVKVGAEMVSDARKWMQTDEGKQFLAEEEAKGSLGQSFILQESGKEQTTVPKYHPLGLFSLPEISIRKLSLTANYLYAKRKLNMAESVARQYAAEAVRFQAFSYNLGSVSRILRSPSGKLFGQFKTYLIKELEFISTLKGKQWLRYVGMQLALGGPRALLVTMKSFPLLGMMGLFPAIEDWLNRNAGRVSRGVPGLLGFDISQASTFQFPQEPTEWTGPTMAEAYRLFTEVVVPAFKGQDFIFPSSMEEVKGVLPGQPSMTAMTDWVKGFAPIAYYWDQIIQTAVTKDGWIRDKNGNKMYRVGDTYEKKLLNALKLATGAQPLEVSRYRLAEQVTRSSIQKRVANRNRLSRKINLKLIRGKNLTEEDVQQMIAFGLSPQSIFRKRKVSEMTPEQRNIARVNLIDKVRTLNTFDLQ